MKKINTPFKIKGLELKNRIAMAPMCQYSVSKEDGVPNNWHFVHYVSRAVGGTGLIIMEMTGVTPDGRITNQDTGLWDDRQIPAYREIVDEVHEHGAKIGIQIAHAGRKAEDAKPPLAPSEVQGEALAEETKHGALKIPRALTVEEIKDTVVKFKEAAERAVEAGFDTIEVHGAHGYLLHQFMSPSINHRTDEYGDFSRFGVEVVQAIKSVMPENMPLIMRISAIEYLDGGYDLDHSLKMGGAFKDAGVDAFHISTGGEGIPGELKPGNYPAYQVPFAQEFKNKFELPVIAVGMLDEPKVAESVLSNGHADLVAVARGMLNDPYWTMHAIKKVTHEIDPPVQYERGIR